MKVNSDWRVNGDDKELYMLGMRINNVRRRRMISLLTVVAMVQILTAAWSENVQAQSYYGAPYFFSDSGTPYGTVEDAINAYLKRWYASCTANHTSCAYTAKSYDPNTNAGLAAIVNGGVSVEAVRWAYSPIKNLGGAGASGCPCDKSGEGGKVGGSAPHGSSGDSSLDAQVVGIYAPMQGDPINAATGNKFQQDTDFRGSSWLTFRRFYNSNESVESTTLGPQWRHSFNRSLDIAQFISDPRPTGIDLERPDGSREHFKPSGMAWANDADSPDTLTEHDDASGNPTGYTAFIAALNHTEQYNAQGQLQSVADPTGQGITLTYSTAATPITVAPEPNLLLTVTDTQGRQLSFTYNTQGNLAQVALPDGGTLAYGYDASTGNLTSVKYPDGKTLQYVYNESSLTGGGSIPGALTGVIDEAGVRYETTGYNYYSSNAAVSSSFAGGADAMKVSVGYGPSTAVTTPLGANVTLNYTGILGAYKPGSINQTCGVQCNAPYKSNTYDANGYPATATDFNGHITKTTYDANGLLDQEIDASGTAQQRTTTTTWNTTLRVPLTRTVQDNNGHTVASTAWVYNSAAQTLARCEIDPTNAAATGYTCSNTGSVPAGVRRWTYTYCTAVDSTQCPIVGLLLTSTGPRTDLTQTTTYSYYLTASVVSCGTPGAACYQPGDLKSVTNALGQTTTYASYDGAGRVTRRIDPNGIVTDLTYTPRGWLASRTVRANADGSASSGDATTSMTYTPFGAVTTVTDPDGVVITYGYDQAHRLTKITDAQGNYVQYTLDASGNRTAENTYAAGSTIASRTLSRTYNTLGQLTKITDGLGHVVFDASASGNYDGNGNLVQSKDANGFVRLNSYDALDRLTKTIANYNGADAATKNTTTQSTYDALDHLTQVIDPSSLATTYGYDGLSNATSLQSPDTATSSSTYDAAGNVLTHTDAKGIVATSTYDALNRLTGTSYSDNAQTSDNATYTYDEANSVTGCASSYALGRLTRIVESAVTTVYCYDARGNVTRKQQITASGTDAIAYAYTLADRLSSITYPSGTQTSYAFDTDGRIQSVTLTPLGGNARAAVSSISYQPFGPISSYTLGNGQTVTRSYDTNYALTDLTSFALNLHFARDLMGNISAEGNAPGANPATESYIYDPLYRLKSIEQGSTNIEALTYNPTGDRTSKTGGGLATGTYGYNTGTHQLTSVGSAAWTLDANGNTTGNAGGGQAWGYGYNGRHRLIVVQANGATVGAYTYNVLGQRIQKVVALPAAITERFDYDEAGRLITEYGSNNRDYLWLSGMPVATVDTTGSASSVSYVVADHLGTPRAVTDSSGNVIWTWPFAGNPFGELTPTSSGGYTLNLRYPGQYFDAESGLRHNGHRDYCAACGRYIQSDPKGLFGGQLSTYAYVGGNPTSNVDPTGLGVGAQAAEDAFMESEALKYSEDPAVKAAEEQMIARMRFVDPDDPSTWPPTREQPALQCRGAAVQSGTDIVRSTAQGHASSGARALMNYMSRGEQAAYLEDPDNGWHFLGQAVHNATADTLQQLYGDRFQYNRVGPDFLDTQTGEIIELTTPGAVSSYAVF
ncbi:RHS repeat-associated core domain-containing protein [Burkholderia cepacia]|uniref:RHS repeat-associated core domain-containing protein n=1 Tax=Burkholderia cepacia TaxID=292 RepID=UPI00158A4555|nr:RHS repeat-associated core domain-containing protein [Burkholderia cepacia]